MGFLKKHIQLKAKLGLNVRVRHLASTALTVWSNHTSSTILVMWPTAGVSYKPRKKKKKKAAGANEGEQEHGP